MSNEPIVGYRSIITGANISSFPSSELGFPVAALANGLTYDRARFAASGTARIYIDAGAPVTCDYLGIAAHNLADFGAAVYLYGSAVPIPPGLDGTNIAIYPVTSNAPRLFTFAPTAYRYWEIQIAGAIAPGQFYDVAVMYLGGRLTFERCLMKTHAPAPYNRVTDFYDNSSESGQFLGRSIMRRGFTTEVSFDMASAAWIRSQFQPFVRAARLSPYFFAWNPGTYPDEVVFGRTAKDIGVDYTGDRDRMKANWQIEGLGYDE